MELIRRNRVYPVDVLKIDYEFCSTYFHDEGERNSLGERSRVLRKRMDNVRCSIDPLIRTPSYVSQSGLREILTQGIIEKSAFIMTLSANEEILPGDIVKNYDNDSFEVLHVINFYSHKEAFLKKLIG